MQKILLLLLLVAQGTSRPNPSLVWENFHAPEYPRDAQIAHIAGTVKIEFTIGRNGVITIGKSTGHPLLVPAAEKGVKASKFSCKDCEDNTEALAVVFDFSIANHDCREAEMNPPYTAKLDSNGHVSIIAEPVCTSDPVVKTVHKRSLRCLYLWKCGTIWLQ